MSIESGHEHVFYQDLEPSFTKPTFLGMLPTAMAACVKSSLPVVGKVSAVGALALSGLALCLKETPHEHPRVFTDRHTGRPLQPGDLTELHDPITGELVKKLVVGYSAHHTKVIDAHAVKTDPYRQTLLAQMRDKPLWTGPYDLVAKGYAGKNKQLALVVADPVDFKELCRHDVSTEGSFESLDGALAIAVSSEGQQRFNVDLVFPVHVGKENIPGFKGTVHRALSGSQKLDHLLDPSLLNLSQKHIEFL